MSRSTDRTSGDGNEIAAADPLQRILKKLHGKGQTTNRLGGDNN